MSVASHQPPTVTSPAPESAPWGWRWLLLFQIANAVNYTISLGAPMVLAAKCLGASETIVGLILGFTPFLVVLQPLADNAVGRQGPRHLVLQGWSARSYMILLAAPLFLLQPFGVPAGWLLAALTLLSLAFNIIRGYTCLGYLPWIYRVIPDELRGRYFGFEQVAGNVGVLLTLLLAGWFMKWVGGPWKYSVLFAVAWLAGMISVRFLNRVPENAPGVTPPPPRPARNWRTQAAAYRDLWRHRGFRRITLLAMLNGLATAAVPGFLVVFLRDHLEISESAILVLSACGSFGPMLTAVFWGRLTDRFGSRPVLRLAWIVQLLLLLFWTLAAAGILAPAGHWQLGLLLVLNGAVSSAAAIAVVRLLLRSCPETEVTTGVTLHCVLVSVCCGLAPMFWGVALDRLAVLLPTAGPWQPFTIFFLAAVAGTLLAQLLLSRLRETQAVPTSHVMLTLLRDAQTRVLGIVGNWFGPGGGR